jgi:putative ABC transport system substrate-binding protein
MPEANPNVKVLLGALNGRGYKVGENLVYEGPAGPPGLPVPPSKIVDELKARKVDLIVAWGFPVVQAAKTAGIPTVVAFGVGDPVATGLVKTLAQPGGVVTGISDVATTLSTKRLGLLKELLPKLNRVAMLWNKDDLGMSLRYEASAKAAQAMGADVEAVGIREPDDFAEAFALMDRERPNAILMVSDSLVHEGGLMSYGADLKESFERAAAMVDRIFKGTSPGELPFEQPTRYPFVINLKTAKSIGLEFPPTLLALADEVIE